MRKLVFLCIGILTLLIVGCGGSSKSTYGANSPEGVAQAYYQALADGKPDAAYQYRKFDATKTKEQFVNERKSSGMTFKNFKVGKGQITGMSAVVPVTFETGNSSMPEFTMNIRLVKEKSWLISDMGMGGQSGAATTDSTGTAPSDSTGTTMPPASGANPHGAGGSIPLK